MSEETKLPTRWHGLTDEQWLALFEASNYRTIVAKTLVEIASCRRIEPENRMAALQLLNKSIQIGLVNDESCLYPELARDTLLSLARGERRGSKRLRRRMSDRLMGVDGLINTMAQFLPKRDRVSSSVVANLLS